MSYYPILNAPGCEGWVGLCNFPPNNWEVVNCRQQFINVTWISNNMWKTKNIDVLKYGACKIIKHADISNFVNDSSFALISLTRSVPTEESILLPSLDVANSFVPAWRATLGLSTISAKTSFQGELDPFPQNGSLLTFGPFIQFGIDINNFIILINLEKSAFTRNAKLEVFDADKLTQKGCFTIKNNSVNIIPLEKCDFEPSDLPVFICRNMAAIPLYFTSTVDGSYLSIEHTHPPSSLVLHGRRWDAQKLLKSKWFSKLPQ